MKNRIKAFVLCIILVFNFPIVSYADELQEASANDWETIRINTCEDLIELADNCRLDTWSSNKQVELESDIIIDDESFTCIPCFNGIFDGNGHSITNLYYKGNESYIGFFAFVGKTGIVKNLKIAGKVEPSGKQVAIGGIVGENNGIISNCSFTGLVCGKDYVGGIAGINKINGHISDCSFEGRITGVHFSGGIAGYNIGSIIRCTNNGKVNTAQTDSRMSLEDINIDDYISVISPDNNEENPDKAASNNGVVDCGGIVGLSTGNIQACENKGEVGYEHVGYNIGGIAGRQSGYISGCKNFGVVCGRKDVGGIVGQAEPYISVDLSKDIAYQLSVNIEELQSALNRTIRDAGNSSDVISDRLSVIQQFTASALEDSRYIADSSISYANDLSNAASDIFSRADYIMDESTKKDGLFDNVSYSADNTKEAAYKLKDTVNDLDLERYLTDSEKQEYDDSKQLIEDSSKEYNDYIDKAKKPYYNYYIFTHENTTYSSQDLAFIADSDDKYIYNTAAINTPGNGMNSSSNYTQSSFLGINDMPNDDTMFFDEFGKSGTWYHHDDVNGKDNPFPDTSSETQAQNDNNLIAEATSYSAQKSDEYASNKYQSVHGKSYTVDMEDAAKSIAKLTEAHLPEMSDEARSDAQASMDKLGTASDDLKRAGNQANDIFSNLSNREDISIPRFSDDYRSHASSLSANLQGMNDNFGYLNAQMHDSNDVLLDDLADVSDRFANIMMLYTDAIDGVLDKDYTSNIQDSSLEVAESCTDATIDSCTNVGEIYGDLNTSGIAGTMAIEYDFDLESDVSGIKDSKLNTTYLTKCVLRSDINRGIVTAEKSYAGGICGLQEMGTIIGCANYEEVKSNSGDYVGGIAGSSLSNILRCNSKCILSGQGYVGGIAGDGTDIYDCLSLVNISDSQNWYGAIAGHVSDAADIKDNFFVSDKLGGIDRISYSGKAVPVSYDELFSIFASRNDNQSLPNDFNTMRIIYVLDDPDSEDDGKILGESSVGYGDTPDNILPQTDIQKDGFYPDFEDTPEERVYHDEKIKVSFVRYKTTLAGPISENKLQSSLLVDGHFKENDVLDAVKDADINEKAEKDGIIETWHISIPDDGSDIHTIRYLPDKDSDLEKLEKIGLYVYEDNGWKEIESTGSMGRYKTYQVKGKDLTLQARIKNISRINRAVIATVIICICTVILILYLISKFFYIKRNKIAKTAQKIGEAAKEAAQNIGNKNQIFYHGESVDEENTKNETDDDISEHSNDEIEK